MSAFFGRGCLILASSFTNADLDTLSLGRCIRLRFTLSVTAILRRSKNGYSDTPDTARRVAPADADFVALRARLIAIRGGWQPQQLALLPDAEFAVFRVDPSALSSVLFLRKSSSTFSLPICRNSVSSSTSAAAWPDRSRRYPATDPAPASSKWQPDSDGG